MGTVQIMNVAILGYRDWARELWRKVDSKSGVHNYVNYYEFVDDVPADTPLVFLVGWSNIVPVEFYVNRTVIVLHPSPLPKYRGGSPIQHQILNGETQSAVTLCKLDPAYQAVDSGPIVSSRPYSLEGDLSEVLTRIVEVGAVLINRAIEDFNDGALPFTTQAESQATTFKRRKPEESKILTSEFDLDRSRPNGVASGLTIHNKVRALQDPYPNAFVQFRDGRLYITQTRWEPNTDSVDQSKADKFRSEIRTKDGKPK